MPTSDNITASINPLYNTSYKLVFTRIPNVTFLCQTVSMPGVAIGPAMAATRFADVKEPGDTMDFDNLSITMLLDENLAGYIEVFKWMKDIGRPEVPTPEELSNKDLMSDAELVITSNALAGRSLSVRFKCCWPTILDGIDFSSVGNEPQPISVNVQFAFTTYDIIDLSDVATECPIG